MLEHRLPHTNIIL